MLKQIWTLSHIKYPSLISTPFCRVSLGKIFPRYFRILLTYQFTSFFRHKYNMIFTIPTGMTQTFMIWYRPTSCLFSREQRLPILRYWSNLWSLFCKSGGLLIVNYLPILNFSLKVNIAHRFWQTNQNFLPYIAFLQHIELINYRL